MSFSSTSRPRSRIARTCPECRETIPVGAQYLKYCFGDRGDFIHGLHCLPCEELSEAFGSSLHLFDPWTEGYVPGALFEEAAEHCGLDENAESERPAADRRTALIAALKEMDRDEIAGRREEARQRAQRNREILARLAQAGYGQNDKGLTRHP
jgi:hypothetical protein